MANNELVGKNKFEMLVFSIADRVFGINVFKVREIIKYEGSQQINQVPGGHENVLGVTSIRGTTMPVINLAKTLGIPGSQENSGFFIITEFNRTVQALKIDSVSKIQNVSWKDVMEPPKIAGRNSYLTSVINLDDNMIQILDVEKVLSEIQGTDGDDSRETSDGQSFITSDKGQGKKVLIVDDSKVAQGQLGKAVRKLGFDVEFKSNGEEALEHLVAISENTSLEDHYSAVISDIEMPIMDGYTLVAELRNRNFNDLNIIMHTSMSGNFNQAMVDKVGANDFIAKFNAREIQQSILDSVFKENRIAA